MSVSKVRFTVTITSSPAYPGGSFFVEAATGLLAYDAAKAKIQADLDAAQANAAVIQEALNTF
jgi:hypothetical protein